MIRDALRRHGRLSSHLGRCRARGFTLLEVLVAFAILAVAMVVLLRIFSETLDRVGRVDGEVAAAAAARSLLDRLGTDLPLEEGVGSGTLPGNLAWTLDVAPYGDSADWAAWPLKAYRVSLDLSWSQGGGERSLSLSTLKLAPKGSSQ